MTQRKYTYGGHYAHLLPPEVDSEIPHTQALCGYSPRWKVTWMGSGTPLERQYANSLPTCRRCQQKEGENNATIIT